MTVEDKKQVIDQLRQGGWKAIVFDIDGTLFPRTSANHAIFSELGSVDFMRNFEEAYAAGLVGNDDVAVALAAHFAGHSTKQLSAMLSDGDFMHDAVELSRYLQHAGITVLVATVTWRFVADWVATQLSGEAISGVELEERSGLLTGKVARHSHAIHKTEALRLWCIANRVSMHRCVAIGDSRSDLDIFDNVGLPLAINASTEAKKASKFAGDFDSLWQLLAHAPLNKN